MEHIVKRLMENHRVDESKKIDFKKMEEEIRSKVKEVMMSPEFGFEEEDVDRYSVVEFREEEDFYVMEVRAEVSYDGEVMLCEALDPIVAKYDKDAYFEPNSPGIIDAYFEK